MTLRQEFDDIMNKVFEIASLGAEEEFIETVVGAMEINDEIKRCEEEGKKLEKIVAEKEKQLAKKRAEFKKCRAQLEKKKKQFEATQKEKRSLDKILEEVRRSVMRKDVDVTSVDLLSLMETFSCSETSEEKKE